MCKWSIFIMLFVASFSLFANEDLDRLVTLAEDSRDVVIEVEKQDGVLNPETEFVLDEKTTDFVMGLQDMDKEIAAIVPESLIDSDGDNPQPNKEAGTEPCDDEYGVSSEVAERIKERKFQIYFTATFSSQAELGLNPGFSGKHNYRNFMVTESQNGHPDAYQIRTLSALEAKYLREEKPKDWDDLSLRERAVRLHGFAGSYSGANPSCGDVRYTSPDDKTRVRTGLSYEGFVSHKNEQEGPDSGFTLATDKIVWSTAVEHDITPDMMFSGESAIVLRNIGNTAAFKGAITDSRRNISADITYQTPLSDDVPAFNPMPGESVGVGVIKRWGDDNDRIQPTFSLNYTKDLDYGFESVNAGFGFKF